jgi:phosphonate degradation associated HDIG domain protein
MISFVDEIFAAFDAYGAQRYGERVTQLEHALQCAHLAALEGAPETLVAAALLHDFGHFVDNRGLMAEEQGLDGAHESVGAATLSAWFGAAVTRPIALHVAAKRYLCAVEAGYFEALSPASQLSLELQGGPYDRKAAEQFAALPFAAEAIRLRRWDDCGKVMDMNDLAPLASYRTLLMAVAKVVHQTDIGHG